MRDLALQHRVEQARLADVRPAEEGDFGDGRGGAEGDGSEFGGRPEEFRRVGEEEGVRVG